MTELQQYINLYFGIDEKSLEKIEQLFKKKTLKKNDYICKAGEYCKNLSFIKSGTIRVFNYTDGKEITQWISSEGSFITDLSSIVFDTTANWNIQALTDCELYTISKEDYNKIGFHVKQWDKLEKLFIAKCFITLENRVYSFLSMTAEERYNQLFELNKRLFNEVPLQYLASMLGMTPETLSRIRKKAVS